MTRWQYRTAFLPPPLSEDRLAILDELGRDGWEAIGVSTMTKRNETIEERGMTGKITGFRTVSTDGPLNIFILFKRPMPKQ
jgi:hypothetical protein